MGNLILNKLDNYFNKTEFYERLFKIDHPIYHHDLRPNTSYKLNKSFDGKYFTFCTDNNGFRYKCNFQRKKYFDIGFMGDSFTEGASLDYEDTFVGLFEKKYNKKIANLGVGTYAPTIYLSKINFLLNNGYKFNEIILFIDVSDLYDDNVYYYIDKNFVVKENYKVIKQNKFKRFLRMNFRVTNYFFYVLKRKKLKDNNFISSELKQNTRDNPEFDNHVNLKSSWTYTLADYIEGYDGSINEAKKKQIEVVNKIYLLLKENKIDLSIAVYPWPQTLMNDKEKSVYAEMWREFCVNKCKNFINFLPIFFQEMNNSSFIEVYKKYYWWNDVHFNKKGNMLIADELFKYF